MSNSERLIEVLAEVFGAEGEIDVDDALIDRMLIALRPLTAPDLTGMMTGQGAADRPLDGVEGLRTAWADWLDSFARVRLEFEGMEQVGENVVVLARQIGTTRHGVEIEQPSAAVWKFRDGMLTRVEFHLDRAAAVESARAAD